MDEQAREFGDHVGDLLSRTLPNAPGALVSVVGDKLRLTPHGQTVDENGREHGGVPLCVNDVQLAWLRVNYLLRPDRMQQYLAVAGSKYWVVSKKERSPLFRYDYRYEAATEPHSHIQLHAERGAVSHLLTRTGHTSPHDLSTLRFPTGGSRFRPGLEDVLQFLIGDCGFDCLDGWKTAVKEHRARWRAIQTRAAARAMAQEAAEQLRELGYTVTPPPDGEPEPGEKARFAW